MKIYGIQLMKVKVLAESSYSIYFHRALSVPAMSTDVSQVGLLSSILFKTASILLTYRGNSVELFILIEWVFTYLVIFITHIFFLIIFLYRFIFFLVCVCCLCLRIRFLSDISCPLISNSRFCGFIFSNLTSNWFDRRAWPETLKYLFVAVLKRKFKYTKIHLGPLLKTSW